MKLNKAIQNKPVFKIKLLYKMDHNIKEVYNRIYHMDMGFKNIQMETNFQVISQEAKSMEWVNF